METRREKPIQQKQKAGIVTSLNDTHKGDIRKIRHSPSRMKWRMESTSGLVPNKNLHIIIPNMVFPRFGGGGGIAAFWACASKLSWTLLSPARVHPPIWGGKKGEFRDSMVFFSNALNRLSFTGQGIGRSKIDWKSVRAESIVIRKNNPLLVLVHNPKSQSHKPDFDKVLPLIN